jgi:hypothetical protein
MDSFIFKIKNIVYIYKNLFFQKQHESNLILTHNCPLLTQNYFFSFHFISNILDNMCSKGFF